MKINKGAYFGLLANCFLFTAFLLAWGRDYNFAVEWNWSGLYAFLVIGNGFNILWSVKEGKE